jgi:hypothetical protein
MLSVQGTSKREQGDELVYPTKTENQVSLQGTGQGVEWWWKTWEEMVENIQHGDNKTKYQHLLQMSTQ